MALPDVSVILCRQELRVPSAVGGDYGFLNYHIIFIPEYSIPNLPEDFYD